MRFLGLLALVCLPVLAATPPAPSPYVGQQQRAIKTLSASDIEGYHKGSGMGYAKAAELNRYPGPIHVLDLSSPLALTPAQQKQTRTIYDRMHGEATGAPSLARGPRLDPIGEATGAPSLARGPRLDPIGEAVALGRQIVDREASLDALFAGRTADNDKIERLTREIALLQARLRFVHLRARLEMAAVLTPAQIDAYQHLRGYRDSHGGGHQHQH